MGISSMRFFLQCKRLVRLLVQFGLFLFTTTIKEQSLFKMYTKQVHQLERGRSFSSSRGRAAEIVF